MSENVESFVLEQLRAIRESQERTERRVDALDGMADDDD